MAFGLFKKMVIADRLAILVNEVYNNPEIYSGTDLIIATIFFAFQIYCDFSGYSDIAIGIARTMGFDLMKNLLQIFGVDGIFLYLLGLEIMYISLWEEVEKVSIDFI